MRSSNLIVNQLSPAAFEAYLRYLEAVDSKDLDAFATFLADDVEMIMGNTPAVRGKAAVVEGLARFWPAFRGVEHDLLAILGNDRHYMLEALNHYTRHDGKEVTVRAVAITTKNEDGLVTSFHVYSDVSPVFA